MSEFQLRDTQEEKKKLEKEIVIIVLYSKFY